MAQWKNLEMVKNTTRVFELNFTKDGVFKDITGWTVYFYLKKKMTDSDANAKISKTITTHSDPTNGTTLITIDVADTSSLTSGNFFFTMDWKDTDDNEGVLFSGRFKLKESVIKERA